jgi:hypothetical protein
VIGWQIVGNQPVDNERIPWPTYKVVTAARPNGIPRSKLS